jgi:5-methyltetrahydrofolate--homocysteine methyltransferase
MPRWSTVPQEHWERASKMRREPTRAEQLLWSALRRQLPEVSFRRQHPIGIYIVDFVCLKAKLIVEIDGDVHALPDQKEHDAVRDSHLRSRGFRVVRYANDAVVNNCDGVLLDIRRLLEL